MPDLAITDHAVERYKQRVRNIPDDEVRLALDTPAVRLAIRIRAPFVKLGSGHHVLIRGQTIVTILPPETALCSLATRHD